MILEDVMEQLATQADTIAGLRAFDIPLGPVNPPTFFLELPEDINYDGTYSRGMDALTLTGVLLIGKAASRESAVAIRPYLNGSGAQSIKTVMESGTYTAMDTVHVSHAELAVYTFAAVAYLGAEFTIEITGSGA
jgi:hypothetical protein